MVVKKANSLRYVRSVLVVGSVGGELRHRCGVTKRKIMYADKWELRHWFLTEICNITTSPGDE